MALEVSWLTKHERQVIRSGLERERDHKAKLSRLAARAKTRAMAGADAFVASDLLRQLADR